MDYDHPEDGNTPRTYLATLSDIALPQIMLELSTKPFYFPAQSHFQLDL